RSIIYAAKRGELDGLWIRPLNQNSESFLSGTENGRMPFLSSDGQWIAFFADGTLKKVRLSGGPAITICNAESGRGGVWSGDTIVFAPLARAALSRVSAAGGNPEPITTIDANTESTHRWLTAIPGTSSILFTATLRGDYAQSHIDVLDVTTK